MQVYGRIAPSDLICAAAAALLAYRPVLVFLTASRLSQFATEAVGRDDGSKRETVALVGESLLSPWALVLVDIAVPAALGPESDSLIE